MKGAMKRTSAGVLGRAGLLILALSLLVGCEALQPRKASFTWPDLSAVGGRSTAFEETEDALAAREAAAASQEESAREPVLYRGTGRFVGPPAADVPAVSSDSPGEFTLNFQNADLREVIAVVLGDLLAANYVLDPAVQGGVTLQTSRALRREDLLPTLETLLRVHGFAAVQRDDGYHVLPLGKAVRGQLAPQLGDSNAPIPPGFALRIVPLSYIAASEMAEILEPIVQGNSIVRVDNRRNLLILAGTGVELNYILDTIEVFDVDWVKGMSVGFFPLQNASAVELEAKLQGILGAKGGLMDGGAGKGGAQVGLVRIAVVESANGLLVVTPQPAYLETIGEWIGRLDQIDAVGGDERELYVYRVKSGEAAGLAELLNALLGGSSTTVRGERVSLAPGERPATLTTPTNALTGDTPRVASPPAARTQGRLVVTESTEDGIRVVADESRNSLLITATAREYRKIKKALEQLDIPPLQVMIEATIIEVELKGDLRFGLQWFFSGSSGDYTGNASLDGTIDGGSGSGLGGIFPGFNFSIINGAGEVRAVFSALAEDSLINVLSSPSVMVLDNGTARIQVGDQVPIATQQQQSTAENANVVNTIQYRDTGIVLEVTPRVTPGGQVTMVVSQEVSDVSATQTSTLDSPTISTRQISSTVAVQDGQAVILGGLIRERTGNSNGGIPGLKNLPGVGWLFGEQVDSNQRRELVVILAPRIIVNAEDVERVTDDFRARMQRLEGAF
jgi:general secretion pathway protein D